MTTLKKTIIALLAITLLLAAALSFWLFWEGSTKEIVSVADELKTPSDWRVTANRVTPPKNLCLDAVICPSIHRTWIVNHALTKNDLEEILRKSGWDFYFDQECIITKDMHGTGVPLCRTEGEKSGFKITIVAWGTYDKPSEMKINMHIKER